MSKLNTSATFKATFFAILLVPIHIFGSILIALLGHYLNFNLDIVSSLLISQFGFLLLPVIVYFLITKDPVRKTLRLELMSLPDILRVLAITFLIQPLIMGISGLGSLFFPNYLVNFTAEINSSVSFPFLLMLTALFPALFEEFCMRGIVLSGYRGKKLWIAACINGLLFAVLHLNIQQGLYAFVLGFIFVYLVDAANSIFASITSHFAINASQMTLLHLTSKNLEEAGQSLANVQANSSKESLIASIVLLLVLGSITSIFAYRIYKGLKKNNSVI
ncbi:CAAX amino terminal protease self- immunity [Oxobacter pfennigii]|uniref:CAAX amino terminal protease self-immunity n=1 Tax=Oxobacter pfennigii TaxID=36849 RepID=A0A0P8YT55_9CLOT|nr:type II CAAX endopeptidase family protein [Oxobacter pfennigii]KPU42862.1 CAAX amino terminal protease self- immunity [Oxobacter pfennigii]